ncbi:ribosome hibernation-promoting factor [Gammaproteobacteria bacterium]
MQINVTGHHVEVTPALRDYVVSKLERLERHFDQVTQVHVVLMVEKLRHQIEANLNLNGVQIFAKEESESMYAAIDALADKLDRQIMRHKEKTTDHRRR